MLSSFINANSTTFDWKSQLNRYNYVNCSRNTISSFRWKKRPLIYSDRNKKTLSYWALEWLASKRIFARRVNENDGIGEADLVAIIDSKKVFIKLNPVNENRQVDSQSLLNKEKQTLVVVDSMQHLTTYFKETYNRY